jgi:hypothetical protein
MKLIFCATFLLFAMSATRFVAHSRVLPLKKIVWVPVAAGPGALTGNARIAQERPSNDDFRFPQRGAYHKPLRHEVPGRELLLERNQPTRLLSGEANLLFGENLLDRMQ